MTATIITKNSSTASAVPAAGSLTQGELAVNVTDKKLYTKDSGGSVVKVVGSLGNQEANAAAITGGAIDGATVGAATPSTGAFTTLTSSSTTTLNGTSIPASKTLVDTDSAQTLTNKTIANTSITGLGTMSTQNSSNVTITGGSISGITDLAVADGGTGASTAAGARTNILPSYTGNSGKILAVNIGETDVEFITVAGTGTVTQINTGTGLTGGPITASGTISIDTAVVEQKQKTVSVISTNTNAAAYTHYVLTASLTLTLPATPTAGQWVSVQNSSGTTTAVIGRNGSNIMSLAENMTLDASFVAVTLIYADATRGWVFA